jgi:chorismate synthase
MEILGGPLFGVAGAGESHGPGITTIVFGCPPGLFVERRAIQAFLDRRRPGSNKHGTPRREADSVVLLSGLYQADLDALLTGTEVATYIDGAEARAPGYEAGYTTGEPISALVLSTAKRSDDYRQFSGPEGEVRPGHTDLVKHYKSQGFVDVRGGGRSSYRSTVSDVIGGSIARTYLQQHFSTIFLSSIVQVGPLRAKRTLAGCLQEYLSKNSGTKVDSTFIQSLQNDLDDAEIPAIDLDFAKAAAALIKETRIQGDSLGAAVEVIAVNPPALIGEPL